MEGSDLRWRGGDCLAQLHSPRPGCGKVSLPPPGSTRLARAAARFPSHAAGLARSAARLHLPVPLPGPGRGAARLHSPCPWVPRAGQDSRSTSTTDEAGLHPETGWGGLEPPISTPGLSPPSTITGGKPAGTVISDLDGGER